MCNSVHVCPHVAANSCSLVKERDGERKKEKERAHHYQGSLRAFVFIMAPIYPLMTTRERSAGITVRRSYDIFLADR